METNMKMKATEFPFSLIEYEILPRLPSKFDIGRCMCVCKQWRSFLSTHTFARMHLQNHGTINDYKLLLSDELTFHTLSLNGSKTIHSNPISDTDPNDVFILATLDGLVCLGSNESRQIVFWNPLTGAYKKLSSGPCFYFNKKAGEDVFGFYKDSSGDYKLLCLIVGDDLGAYIYSHRLDSWREIESPYVCDYGVWSEAIFCDQCLYFTVTVYTPIGSDWWVICFDVKTETFRKIRLPLVLDRATDYCGNLVVVNRCVHLCATYQTYNPWMKHGELWRMDGDDGWVQVAAFCKPLPYRYNNYGFRRQRVCTASIGNWLAVLDQDDNSFKKMNSEDFTAHYRYFCSSSFEYRSSRMIYVETLVSPNP